MKKVFMLLIFTVAVMLLAACGSGETVTSATTAATVDTTTSATTSATTANTGHINEKLDESGNVIEKEHYDHREILVKKETFLENGLPETVVDYNDQGMAERYELFGYDESGKLISRYVEEGTYDGTGKILTVKKVYEYNEKDILINEGKYNFSLNGAAVSAYIKNYDENGKLTDSSTAEFKSGNLSKIATTLYDENGKVSAKEEVQYDENGIPSYVSKSEYTPDFVIIKKTEQIIGTATITSREYIYDEDGDLKESAESVVNSAGEIYNISKYTYFKSTGYRATHTEYNIEGEIIAFTEWRESGGFVQEKLTLEIDGKFYWRHKKYDETGKEDEIVVYSKEDNSIYSKTEYYYHENGMIKRIETADASGEIISYMEYNKYGDIIESFPEK